MVQKTQDGQARVLAIKPLNLEICADAVDLSGLNVEEQYVFKNFTIFDFLNSF